jgi:pimeloyl-ACP methyl ester carboxylesterase
MLNRDGVELFYAEAGTGEPPVLLVHGWTCDHTAMAPLFTYFRRSHRVITVDLRGHGESDKPEQDYTMAVFADDLAWMCGELGLEKPIVIGHSMGGVIAVELAARFPDLPSAVVTLDSPVVASAALLDRVKPLVAIRITDLW